MILIILGDKGYGTCMKKRVDKAAFLYKGNPKKYTTIVPTGGRTRKKQQHTEAYVMKRRLIHLHNIPRNKIYIEGRAQNTEENAKFTKKIVKSNDIIVVTSTKHTPRAKRIFERIYNKKIRFVVT